MPPQRRIAWPQPQRTSLNLSQALAQNTSSLQTLPPTSSTSDSHATRPKRLAAASTPQYDLEAAWSPLNRYLTDSDRECNKEDDSDHEIHTPTAHSPDRRPSVLQPSKTVEEDSEEEAETIRLNPQTFGSHRPSQILEVGPSLTTALLKGQSSNSNPSATGRRTYSSDSSTSDVYRASSSASETGTRGKARKRKAENRTGVASRTKKRRMGVKGQKQGYKLKKADVKLLVQFITENLDWKMAAWKIGGVRLEAIRGVETVSGVLGDMTMSSQGSGVNRGGEAEGGRGFGKRKGLDEEELKKAWVEDVGTKLVRCYRS